MSSSIASTSKLSPTESRGRVDMIIEHNSHCTQAFSPSYVNPQDISSCNGCLETLRLMKNDRMTTAGAMKTYRSYIEEEKSQIRSESGVSSQKEELIVDSITLQTYLLEIPSILSRLRLIPFDVLSQETQLSQSQLLLNSTNYQQTSSELLSSYKTTLESLQISAFPISYEKMILYGFYSENINFGTLSTRLVALRYLYRLKNNGSSRVYDSVETLYESRRKMLENELSDELYFNYLKLGPQLPGPFSFDSNDFPILSQLDSDLFDIVKELRDQPLDVALQANYRASLTTSIDPLYEIELDRYAATLDRIGVPPFPFSTAKMILVSLFFVEQPTTITHKLQLLSRTKFCSPKPIRTIWNYFRLLSELRLDHGINQKKKEEIGFFKELKLLMNAPLVPFPNYDLAENAPLLAEFDSNSLKILEKIHTDSYQISKISIIGAQEFIDNHPMKDQLALSLDLYTSSLSYIDLTPHPITIEKILFHLLLSISDQFDLGRGVRSFSKFKNHTRLRPSLREDLFRIGIIRGASNLDLDDIGYAKELNDRAYWNDLEKEIALVIDLHEEYDTREFKNPPNDLHSHTSQNSNSSTSLPILQRPNSIPLSTPKLSRKRSRPDSPFEGSQIRIPLSPKNSNSSLWRRD